MIRVLKAAPGLDQSNLLAKLLGPGHEVVEYDPTKSLSVQGRDADVFILRDVPVTPAIMDSAPRLKLLQRLGHHVVGVDFAHARRKGIAVANIPASVSGGDRMVAEHALFLMLAVAKRANDCAAAIRTRQLSKITAVSLSGKTLGLLGLGNTGAELAKLVAGLGMRVMAVKRTADQALARELGLAYMADMSGLDEMLAQSDFVSIHLPLEPATTGFVGERVLSRMKPGSILINIARAPIVDKVALHAALQQGKVAGAGLDVFWEEPADPADPLLKLPNVMLTPHIAGTTYEVMERLARVAADNIRLVLAGKQPLYPVNEAGH